MAYSSYRILYAAIRNGGYRIEAQETKKTLKAIEINGSKQWVYIRYKNNNNPIILFLHGGPGAAQIYCSDNYFHRLVEKFIVVDWDQRCSGKSYRKESTKKNLTIHQYVEDIRALSEWLIKKFNKEKIIVVGHSWGSVIGLLAVKKYPLLFEYYIGIGQVIDMVEGEKRGYYFALEKSKLNNHPDYKKLQKIGPPPHSSLYKTAIFRKILDNYGGFQYQQPSNIWNDYLKEMMISELYNLMDVFRWFKGTNYLVKHFRDELLTIKLKEQVKKLDVPIYFIAGEFDYITPTSLVEEYFKQVECPFKEMIMIENVAHDAHFENPDKFIEICFDILQKFPVYY